eukprot:3629377-Rhodomonas_salina.1
MCGRDKHHACGERGQECRWREWKETSEGGRSRKSHVSWRDVKETCDVSWRGVAWRDAAEWGVRSQSPSGSSAT